jgi:hypothetical protein
VSASRGPLQWERFTTAGPNTALRHGPVLFVPSVDAMDSMKLLFHRIIEEAITSTNSIRLAHDRCQRGRLSVRPVCQPVSPDFKPTLALFISRLWLFVALFGQVATSGSGLSAITVDAADSPFVLEERSLLHQSETEYQILTGGYFDRESIAVYELSVVCRDHGDPPLTTVRRLPVYVTDENDNQPTFVRSVYTALITENNKPGAVIVQV